MYSPAIGQPAQPMAQSTWMISLREGKILCWILVSALLWTTTCGNAQLRMVPER